MPLANVGIYNYLKCLRYGFRHYYVGQEVQVQISEIRHLLKQTERSTACM